MDLGKVVTIVRKIDGQLMAAFGSRCQTRSAFASTGVPAPHQALKIISTGCFLAESATMVTLRLTRSARQVPVWRKKDLRDPMPLAIRKETDPKIAKDAPPPFIFEEEGAGVEEWALLRAAFEAEVTTHEEMVAAHQAVVAALAAEVERMSSESDERKGTRLSPKAARQAGEEVLVRVVAAKLRRDALVEGIDLSIGKSGVGALIGSMSSRDFVNIVRNVGGGAIISLLAYTTGAASLGYEASLIGQLVASSLGAGLIIVLTLSNVLG